MKDDLLFSQELEKWLRSDRQKTLGDLTSVFAEKSFAVSFLVLMFLPSLPLPTGGVSHITEAITMLLSLELIMGRRTIWLPKSWQNMDAGKLMSDRAIRLAVVWIKRVERLSNKRLSALMSKSWVLSLVGLMTFIFSLTAFLAPPFTGLDTLPALGVVIISLAVILEDSLILAAGILIGLAGIALVLSAGVALYNGLIHLPSLFL